MSSDVALASFPFWAADEFERLGCRRLLSSGIVTRVREGLGGSHTVVTYPPLDALAPVDTSELLQHICAAPRVNFYAHVAFCEHICPFCHYAKTYSPIGGESELVRTYLDALFAEIDLWTEPLAGSSTASVYIGGGTPTALPRNACTGSQ
jgi:coproporphyrinogen III oxidase-like Fe-S oxidoreductase